MPEPDTTTDNLFRGFDIPRENWSKLPHDLINALHLMTSEAEVKVIIYILRHTWGYGDDEKKITLEEFANGRKRKDRSRIDGGCGMAINSIRDGLKRAVAHGFIIHEQDNRDKARVKNYFSLRMSSIDTRLSTFDSLGAEVDSLESTFDSRTEKDTTRKTLSKDTKRGARKEPRTTPSKTKRDYFRKEFQELANVFIKHSGLKCHDETEITFWENGSKTKNAKGFRQMVADGITPDVLRKAFDYIEAHNRKPANRNDQIIIKSPNSIYSFAIQQRGATTEQASEHEEKEVF